MSIAPRRAIVGVSLNAKGDKLVFRGPKDAAASEFYGTLPGGRWSGAAMAWHCEATPSAAWRLLHHCPIEVEADNAVLSLAERFARTLRPTGTPNDQPALRKTDGWRHQVAGYHFAMPRPGAMLAMGMGTGKSKVAVDLLVNRAAQRALILCPTSVMGVWRREFLRHSPVDASIMVLDSGTVPRKAAAARLELEASARLRRRCFIVCNYESAWRPALEAVALGQQWDAVICDESHRIKGHDSRISRFCGELAKRTEFRLALTGTPMPHSPLDIFAQARFVDRGIYGTSYHHFRNRYAKLNQIFPSKVDEWLNQEELTQRLSLICYQVRSEDVLDLPEVLHHERRCDLSSTGRRVYDGLKEDLIADLDSGKVTAANGLVRLLRLQQATSGYAVEDETGVEHEIDQSKAGLLLDLLEDLPDEPIVVFCWFRHDLRVVEKLAANLRRRYGELSGDRKDGLNDLGQMAEGVEIMGVQMRSGGVGIDLTRARYGIFYSTGCISPGEFDQVLARIHRPGQTRTTHYYHLLVADSVDEMVYRARQERRNVIEGVLSQIRMEG